MRLSRLTLLSTATLIAGLILVMTMLSITVLSASPASPTDVPGAIHGFLYEPPGTTLVPVQEGWIDIKNAAGEHWMGAHSGPDGSFYIPNLPPDIYILRAYPPPDNPHAASLSIEVVVSSGHETPVELFLTEVRISGYVRDCEAEPEERLEGMLVVARDHDWTFWQGDATNPDGEFKIGGVEIGTPYILETFAPPDSEYVPLEPIMVVPITTGVILEMCIPPINIVGAIHDPTGNPVPRAGVVVFNDDFWKETAADEAGNFLFQGLPPGEFWLQAAPPWDAEGLLPSLPFTVTITEPDTLIDVGVITLPEAVKSVSGLVLNAETGATVDNAIVVAHRLDGGGYVDKPVEPSGVFTLSLPGGEWHLKVEPPPPPHPPVEWIFPGPPAWIAFEEPVTVTEEITDVILEVIPTNAKVQGHIVCPPGGVSCAGDPPHWDIWVELHNDEIKNGTELGADYGFEIPIPDGWYELIVHVHHPMLQGPEPIPVFVGPGQTLDVGNIELVAKDAFITGQVRNESGQGVAHILLIGWQPDGFGWGWAETDASGVYTMPVISGEWFVEPHPQPHQPYVFRQRPQLVRVAPGGTVSGIDFKLTAANARIEGIAVNASDPMQGRLWGLDGWAWSEQFVSTDTLEFFSDAPLWDGGFDLKVAGDHYYNVGLHLPPHAPFISGGAGPVRVNPGEIVTLTVPLEHKDALIGGHLIDALTGFPPAKPIWAEVFGEDERGHWVNVGVDPHSAGYELAVVSGTWHLRAWVDPASGYVAIPTTTIVTVQADDFSFPNNFEVWPIGAAISGQVQKPDGSPLPGAFVFAEGESPFIGHFETFAETNETGLFELLVPEGMYVVGAALPENELQAKGWLNPPPIEDVETTVITPATGLALRFRKLDGLISGVISFTPGIVVTPTHPAYVWGWAESGEWAETKAMLNPGTNTFTYTMGVVSDTVWHIGAVYEDWENGLYYESAEAVVPVLPPSGQATQNLELGGPWTIPQPFIVSFDGSQMQTIILPDGVELSIPSGALVVSGTVTLYIFPTHELRPEKDWELIGAGYEIWATDGNGQEITEFNKNVVMTLHYPPDPVLEAQGISENLLIPLYYSTLVGHWILADSYTIDTVNNEITLQIGHFSHWAMSTPLADEQNPIYLPLILK